MMNGRFALERIRGARPVNWRWVDETLINRAWEDPGRRPVTGRTAVDFQDANGNEFAQIVYFEMKRLGESVVALWSRRKLEKPEAPLFRSPSGRTANSARRRPS
jgi:hypothetical protein